MWWEGRRMFSLLTNFLFIQSLGVIALVLLICAFNAKQRKRILELQALEFIFFIIHYVLLLAYAGAVMCTITLLRNLIFMKSDEKKWANHRLWLYVFILLSVATPLFFWEGWITLLPVIGVILGTYSVSRKNPRELRGYMLVAALVWIPYTIIVQSYPGLLSQIVAVGAILSGMYRFDRTVK